MSVDAPERQGEFADPGRIPPTSVFHIGCQLCGVGRHHLCLLSVKAQHGDAPSVEHVQLSYNANIVISAPTGRSVVPYATGGVGGLTMCERPALGVTSDETFLTGNVGGGIKWFAPNRRWGLRGDYRCGVTRSKDDAPAFFGSETRYAHRVYAGVIINAR